jgi:molybdopterin-guanine dinucleotide biosynthesis protein A
MGSDKAFLRLGSKMVIEKLIETLRAANYAPLRIIGPPRPETEQLGLSIQPDLRSDSGPLGGIHAALATATHEFVLVTACDFPFLDRVLLSRLAGLLPGHDAVVPVWQDRPVPVCAFYSVRCLGAVEARLERGSLKAADFLDDVSVRWVKGVELQSLDPRGLSLFNLNTPEDYRIAQEIEAKAED